MVVYLRIAVVAAVIAALAAACTAGLAADQPATDQPQGDRQIAQAPPQPGGPAPRPQQGRMRGRGGRMVRMMAPRMMMPMFVPVAIAVADGKVFVVAGGKLYRFNAETLELEMEVDFLKPAPMPMPMGGRPGQGGQLMPPPPQPGQPGMVPPPPAPPPPAPQPQQ